MWAYTARKKVDFTTVAIFDIIIELNKKSRWVAAMSDPTFQSAKWYAWICSGRGIVLAKIFIRTLTEILEKQ